MATEHPLHIAVKEILRALGTQHKSVTFRYDDACNDPDEPESCHQLPLFVNDDKNQIAKYCQVDALALKAVGGETEVALIIEIEETGISQTKILGKVLASAMCRFYIHDSEKVEPIPISRDAFFIQIIRERDEGRHKREKWDDIENRVREILPIRGSPIRQYCLIHGSLDDFKGDGPGAYRLRNEVSSHLAHEKRPYGRKGDGEQV